MQVQNTSNNLIVSTVPRPYGAPQPFITVRVQRGTSYRALRAMLFSLAAQVELASMATVEAWCVRIEHDTDTSGRVILELVDGTHGESERGVALLQAVVSKAGAQ